MEDHDSSSSGLMIGMIIGGVVALVLIVLVVLGGAFFFVARDVAAPAPGPPAVAFGPVAEEVAEVPPAEVPVVPPGFQPVFDAKFDKIHKRLFGTWTGKLADGVEATLHLRDDGTLELVTSRPGEEKARGTGGRWNIVEDEGKRVRLNYFTPAGAMTGHHLVWDGDGFRFQSSRTAEGVPINLAGANLDGVVFQRRLDQPK